MVTLNHYTLGDLVLMLNAQIEAEYRTAKKNHLNYVNAFNKKYQYLNKTLREISGKSMKKGTFNAYLNDMPLVLSVLILDKYKKILFTDKNKSTFIVDNPKWLYQYISLKRITTDSRKHFINI